MKRRQFSSRLLGSVLGGTALGTALSSGLFGAPAANAQGVPVEGTHFVRLNTAADTVIPVGKKVDVVEFFWYGCPACNALEPLLEAWIKKLPADVSFRRAHVGFSAPHQFHQKLFYALDEMGQVANAHRKVFAWIHNQNKPLRSEADIPAFAADSGLDSAKLLETMKSFGINTKASRARQLSEAYKIDGVPTIGVQGRFFTAPSLAGGAEKALQVADFLINRARSA